MRISSIVTALITMAPACVLAAPTGMDYVKAEVAVCFRPATPEGCVAPIVDAINSATSEIRVQAYGFTSPPILAALVSAKKRGVDVAVILDKINDPKAGNSTRYSGATYMTNAGIPTFIDRTPKIAHNKVIIIDQHLVVGGSYNYTVSAEKSNAENITLIDSPEVANWFLDNWDTRKQVSDLFVSSSQ